MPRLEQLQVIRGAASNAPTLNDGEFYFATDTGQLYVGLGGVNFKVGAPVMATVSVIGTANPTHSIEPNADGSVNLGTTSVSLGTAAGKTPILKTAQITTAAITQATILTYTVTAGKTFFVEYIDFVGRLTTLSATASVLGTVVLQIAGITSYTWTFVNPTTSDSGSQTVRLMFTEPIPISSATVIAVLTTPAATTSMQWTANFGGYEK